MRDAFFLCRAVEWATSAGKGCFGSLFSPGHQLVSLADLKTTVSKLVSWLGAPTTSY